MKRKWGYDREQGGVMSRYGHLVLLLLVSIGSQHVCTVHADQGFEALSIEWFACLDENTSPNELIEIPLHYYGSETNRAVFRWQKRTFLFFFHSYRPFMDIVCQDKVVRSYDLGHPRVLKPSSLRFGFCLLPSGMQLLITYISDKTYPAITIDSFEIMLNSELPGVMEYIPLCVGSDTEKIRFYYNKESDVLCIANACISRSGDNKGVFINIGECMRSLRGKPSKIGSHTWMVTTNDQVVYCW